ncbi:MAG: PhzF family phenazine biosynthesis protein [Gemmatimonadota bacterium]
MRYFTADVFTERPFGGNPLAVIPDATGLSADQMLSITREFNYAESTFVLPPDDPSNTCRVRIFTPGGEVPFAGHPTIGTAFVLAAIGQLPLRSAETDVILEEKVGNIPVRIRSSGGQPVFCQLSVAKLPELLPPLPVPEVLAPMLSLKVADLAGGTFEPQAFSCGLPFSFVPLRNRDAVRRARLRLDLWESALAAEPHHMVMVFALDPEDAAHDIRARMFAPGLSVPEDPATGSAGAALGGYLAARDRSLTGTLRWTIEQGYEMGRPSQIELEVDKSEGAITAVRVGGASVMMMQGQLLWSG